MHAWPPPVIPLWIKADSSVLVGREAARARGVLRRDASYLARARCGRARKTASACSRAPACRRRCTSSPARRPRSGSRWPRRRETGACCSTSCGSTRPRRACRRCGGQAGSCGGCLVAAAVLGLRAADSHVTARSSRNSTPRCPPSLYPRRCLAARVLQRSCSPALECVLTAHCAAAA